MNQKHSKEVERRIYEVITIFKERGKNVPVIIQDIPQLPVKNYEELKKRISENKLIIWSLNNFNSTTFAMLASPFEMFLTYTKMFFHYLIPIISIVLSFFVSWWFLLGILFFPLATVFGKRLYASVILHAAYHSELLFCFLCFLGEIKLTTFNLDEFWPSSLIEPKISVSEEKLIATLQKNYESFVGTDGDENAKAIERSKKEGKQPVLVHKSEKTNKKYNYAFWLVLVKKYPATSKFLENPENMAVCFDDLEAQLALENSFRELSESVKGHH